MDVVDAVVDEINLPVAVEFAQDGVADQLLVPADDARLDRQAVRRRRFQVADVADAQQRQVQRPRDRRGRHASARGPSCRSFLSRSLCSTPKRCSSSMMTRPRSLNCTSVRHEPMRADNDVDFACGNSLHDAFLFARRLRNRLTTSTTNGYSASRCEKVRKCCSASTVVGTRTATCLPLSMALKAARMASSVLP